jgi:Phage phiEco32-like COOH.NH2 ligase-type 2
MSSTEETVSTKTHPKIKDMFISFGSDPEFFFAKKTMLGKVGKVVGAEKIVPEGGVNGFIAELNKETDEWKLASGKTGGIIIDGVQAEMNPKPDTCRQRMGGELSRMFKLIARLMKENNVVINWDVNVRVPVREMQSLSPKSRQFGCSPSLNAYDEKVELPDAETYPFRSAGGHIHVGHYYQTGKDPMRDLLKGPNADYKKMVKVMDIIVGNTSVLLDRDDGEIQRRTCYGRAGEYRVQPHGLEYRVLGNFWLKNFILTSMVFGLTRLAFGFIENKKAAKELIAAVNESDIRKAINENDFELAQANFNKIKPIIAAWAYNGASLCEANLDNFEKFVKRGIKVCFKKDPVKHWTDPKFDSFSVGWEKWIANFDGTVKKSPYAPVPF